MAFLPQLFKIPFVQLLGQAIFLNYAEFVPLNTTVEPSLKVTSDHNNHLCTKATFLSRQTVHTLNLVQTSLQRQRPLQRVFSCQNNLFNNNQFFSATDEKVKNSHDKLTFVLKGIDHLPYRSLADHDRHVHLGGLVFGYQHDLRYQTARIYSHLGSLYLIFCNK